MLDALRALVNRVRPTRDPLPTPPRTATDDDGRDIDYRGYPARDPDTPTADSAPIDALTTMYVDFDPSMRAQGTPPVGEPAVRDWLDRVTRGPGVVAWHDDHAVGHVSFTPDGEGRHELAVFVHQDYQGAHVGTELVRTGLGHAQTQGVTRVWLTVEAWKQNAQKLYTTTGFTTVDAFGATHRMTRRLSDPDRT